MIPAILAAAAACSFATACGPEKSPAESFYEGIEGSASCQELFDRRNALDPHDPKIEGMNEALRSVGCYMSSDTRKPLTDP